MKKLYSLFIVFLLCFSVTQTFSQMTAPGNALDFAGDDDFVTVAPGVGAIPTSGDYTISLWAKHNALQAGTFFELFSQGNQIYFGGDVSGQIRVGDSWMATGVQYPVDFAWHHFSIVRSGINGYLYIDGTMVASTAGFPAAPATTLIIGNQYVPHLEFFNGQIDEFSIWNRALTQCEIKTNMITELAGTETGLVAYYNFDLGIAGGDNTAITTLIDKTGVNNGNINNFTLNGATSNFVNSSAMTGGKIFVKYDATGSNNGTSWTDAYTSFQSALDVAVCGNQIWVAKGTYKPSYDYGLGGGSRYYHFRMIDGVAIYGGFAGTESAVSERTNFGLGGSNETILSADLNGDDVVTGSGTTLSITNNGENCYHVFLHPNGMLPVLTSTAILDGFTIRGGNANGAGANEGGGGGMCNVQCSPTLNNLIIINNSAGGGSGISLEGNTVTGGNNHTKLSNSIIKDNYAEVAGAGISMNDCSPDAEIRNCIITGNKNAVNPGAFNNGGGGVTIIHTGKLINCLITDNSAPNCSAGGGGVYCDWGTRWGSQGIFIIGSTIANNYALNGGGTNNVINGGEFQNCILWGNTDQSGVSNYIGSSFVNCNTSPLPAGAGNISADPRFANPAVGDFRLINNSPCINTGDNTFNTQAFDIRGEARVQNTTIDIGAYEWTPLLDPTVPVISCPSDVNVGNDAGVCGAVVNYDPATATGDPVIVITYSQDPGTFFPVGTTTVTAIATNAFGSDTCTFNVTVNDTEAPTISCPADISVNSDPGVCGAVVNYTVTYSDNCPGAVLSMGSGLASGSNYPIGTTPHVYYVTDAAGNSTACSFNVTVNDTELPVPNCPSGSFNDAMYTSEGDYLAAVTALSTTTENFDSFVYGDITGPSYSMTNGGVTYTFTAPPGGIWSNTGSMSTNNANDPLITTFSGDPVYGFGGWFTGTDVSGGFMTTNVTLASGVTLNYTFFSNDPSQFVGFTFADPIVSFSIDADDSWGSSWASIDHFMVSTGFSGTITYPADAGQCYAQLSLPASPTDNCGVQSTVYSVSGNPITFPYNFPVGSTTVDVLVTDVNSNTNTCSYDVMINDNEAPTITCAADQTQPNDPGMCEAFVTVIPPTATADNCGVASVINDHTGTADASGIYPAGINPVTWTVTDINGNTTTCIQNIEVTDVEFPDITCPANVSVSNDPGLCSAVVNFALPTVSDNCILTSFSDPLINGSFETGDYTGWTLFSPDLGCTWGIGYAGDILNPGDLLFDYEDMASEVQNSSGLPITFTPTDGNYMGVFLQNNPGPHRMYQDVTLPNGTNNLSLDLQYTNHYSNFNVDQQIAINLRDPGTDTLLTQLFITNPGDPLSIPMTLFTFDISAFAGQNVRIELIEAFVYDHFFDVLIDNIKINGNGSASPMQIAGLPSGSVFPVGITTNTFEITDGGGNTSTCSFDVEVTDDEAPTISCPFAPYGIMRPADVGLCTASITVPAPLVNDNCAVDYYINDFNGTADASGDYPSGLTTVTWTVYDVHGNSSTCQDIVYVNDTQAPVAVAQDLTVYLNTNGFVEIDPADVDGGSTDNCNIINQTISQTMFTCANVGIPNIVTLTVTDAFGNQSTDTATITVMDTTAPVVFCNNITVQLDATGNVTITHDQVFNSGYDACGIDIMSVLPNSFTCAEVGPNTVTLTVSDIFGNIGTCTSTVTVQDNVPPVALCQNLTVYLDATGNASITATDIDAGSNDACGINNLSISNTSFTCDKVGANDIILTVTDNNGNVSSCLSVVTVTDTITPIVVCQDITVQLDASGNASILPADINNGSSDACGIASMTVAPDIFTCANVGMNVVTLTITDVNGNSDTCTSVVTVQDNVAPVALCDYMIVQLDATGNASIIPSDIDNGSSDACGIDTMTVTPYQFTCANVGLNPVLLTVTDVNGNSSTCSTIVVVEDNLAPTAICQDVTVYLNASGNAILNAASINNGSSDECGIASMSVSPSLFTCANVGANTATLTVTDVNGNISTCSSVITVKDTVPPVASCKNITIQLDSYGNASLMPADIDNGSSDACGIDVMTVSPDTFTCINIGANTVTLTVTDVNGNSSTCSATVTVEDNVPPVAVCQNITVQLDAAGNTSILASDVDGGSGDACGINTMTVAPATFTCANVGDNTVTLTVTDNNGNISTCNAIVTVQDVTPPVALCQNITIQLDATGNASITPAQVNNGSNDVCGIASLAVSPNIFTCSNVGSNAVTLTVTDINGNVSSCSATVTVQDNIAPVAICQNNTVQLDATGNVSITSAQVDNGSHDACGIASLVVAPNTFTCANVGANTVTLTVTDNNGNVSTCSATVTVEDNVPPVVVCQNITVYLDQDGLATILPSDVYISSTDACGIDTSSVYPASFNCQNIGDNIVNVTVIDVNGNVTICNSQLTIIDTIAPLIYCPENITVNTVPGMCEANGVVLGFPTFSDNCMLSVIENNHPDSTFALGTTIVTWTATDGSGNTHSCLQTVYVESAPLAVNDSAITQESTQVVIPVLDNDIDCGNNLNPASVIIISPPSNGTVVINPSSGDITYTPDYLFTGNDQFVYQVCDSTGLCSSANVFIEVTPINNPVIGLAKALYNVTLMPDNTFNVSYILTVENLGNDLIENIQVTDDLASIFHSPANYTVVVPPNTNNNLTPNPQFNGESDINLLESATSYLEIGATATITFTLNVQLLGSEQTFCNTATVSGYGAMLNTLVTDISDNGYVTDANANLNPGDEDENDCTPVTLTPSDIFIPEAFSPDGDGKNDFFFIDGIEMYPDNELTIFNRWGNIVYHMKPYDGSGWDGSSDNVLNLGSKKLPQGTYYYVFDYNKDDRPPKKGFIVIKY